MADVHIWKFGDTWWGIGTTIGEAVSDCEDWDMDRDEELGGPIVLMTDDELDNMTFYDDMADQENSPKRTFREQMHLRIANGTAKGFFATTEY